MQGLINKITGSSSSVPAERINLPEPLQADKLQVQNIISEAPPIPHDKSDFCDILAYKFEIDPYGICYNSGITAAPERRLTQDRIKIVKEILEKYKDMPIDRASELADYSQTAYDLPVKFMISAMETASEKGSALIADEIPELFKGLEAEDISKAVSNLSVLSRFQDIDNISIVIKNKIFKVSYIGSGTKGYIYKISDDNGRACALKIFKRPDIVDFCHGSYLEIPIMRQASLDGVIDTPKFYMAEPSAKFVNLGNDEYGDPIISRQGGWMIVQFLDEKTPNRQGNLKFFDWLKAHGLEYRDIKEENKLGGFICDAGGIVSQNGNNIKTCFIQEITEGYMKKNPERAADIIKFLSEKQ